MTNTTTNTRTRRSHRKSRNGCIECKHRHIRCDEHKPICANCEAADRVCSYPETGKAKQRKEKQLRARQSEAATSPAPGTEVSGPGDAKDNDNMDEDVAVLKLASLQQDPRVSSRLSHSSLDSLPYISYLNVTPYQIPSPASPKLGDIHVLPSDRCPGLATVPEHAPKAIFTPQHMILLHHANKVPNFSGRNRNVVDIAIRHAVDSPYLIDEVLAFTAFHISNQYPGSATYLKHLAMELQTRALTTFTRLTEVVPHDDKATAVPRYLFSGILGRHVLADTLTYCHSDFHFFIDRFVECINLNRGIRSVTPPAWKYLDNTEIRPFFTVVREAEEKIVSQGHECDHLNTLMDESDLNEASIKACRKAVTTLQWAFDLCHNLEEEEIPQAASAFSVRIAVEYIDVLRKHRPEALVILAYFGVILSRCRNYWPFAEAGPNLIHAISGQLGTYWQEALAWPIHVLEMERSCGNLTDATSGEFLQRMAHA